MSTNNFDQLLQIQSNQASEENESVPIQKASPKSSSSLSQSSTARLGFILAIVAVPVGIMMFFFSSALNLQASLEKNSGEQITLEVEPSEAENKEARDENLRGIIAYQQQAEAIKNIEQQKLKPEIKLESQESKPEIKPEAISTPVATQSTAVVRRYNSSPVRVTKTQQKFIPKQATKVTTAIQYDSMSDWQNLASLGSYGGNSLATFDSSKKINQVKSTSIKERLLNQKSLAKSGDSLPPVVAGNVSNQQELTQAEAVFLEALQSAEQPQEDPITVRSGNLVAMAQQVKGKLHTGINYAKGMPSQRTFITLEEPLYNSNGEIKIPLSSLLVYEINNVNNGIIEGQIIAVIKEDQQYPLPKNAISVLGKNGNFLMAKYKQVRNGGSNASVLDFALGAAQQTNDLINRPNSSFSSSSQFSSSSSVDYGDRNYAGAIVSGGLEKVLESQTQELKQQRNNSPVSSYWQLKQGSTVMLQVNFPFNI